MAEVLTFFARYKPPSRGYRPTLPKGSHFGKEQLPKGDVGEEEGEEDQEVEGEGGEWRVDNQRVSEESVECEESFYKFQKLIY